MLKKLHIKAKNTDCSGEVMIESTIVTIITIMVLIFLIAIGFLIYQQVLMSDIATESATAIARNYKFSSEVINGNNYSSITIDDKYYEKIKRYRTTFNVASIKEANKRFSKSYINNRMPITSMSFDNDLVIDTDINSSSPGRTFVTVTISMDANLLFDGVLSYGNMDDDATSLSASATAECLDVTGYTSMVAYEHYLASKERDEKAKFDNSINNIKFIIDKVLGK